MLNKVVYIRSRRTGGRDERVEGHPALSCQRDGSLQVNRYGDGTLWEEWEVLKLRPQPKGKGIAVVALRSRHTMKFLSAKRSTAGLVQADGDDIGTRETWTIVEATADFVALKSCFNGYLSCEDGVLVSCEKDFDIKKAGDHQLWALVDSCDALTTNPGAIDIIKKAAASSLLLGGVALTAGALAVPLLGFGAGGVAAGSVAAATQSYVYGAFTTGVFSVLQSAGATGAWASAAGAGATAATVGAKAKQTLSNQNNDA